MGHTHLVVIGASAGGIEALRQLAADLPGDFPAPIAVVLHVSTDSPDILHEILTRSGPLTAVSPSSGEQLQPGRIYVAPPDCHLLIEPGRIRLSNGPRENRFRPAIDPLFRTAAQVYGPRAIGVVLTGNLDDGTAGLWTIKQLGGIAIVQDPADALFPSMPTHVLNSVPVDHVVPVADLAPLLVRLAAARVTTDPTPPAPRSLDIETRIARDEDAIAAGVMEMGEPSKFACPECHGVLLRIKEAGPIRFRCHTGHAYSVESLRQDIGDGIEQALWNAIRSLQEGGLLLTELGAHHEQRHGAGSGRDLTSRGQALMRQADVLRELTSHIDE